LITNPLVDVNEREVIRAVRDLYIGYISTHGVSVPADNIMSVMNMGERVVSRMLVPEEEYPRMAEAAENFEEMFAKDRAARGIRVPSRGYQLVDEDGLILKTLFFDVDKHQLCVEGDYFAKHWMMDVRLKSTNLSTPRLPYIPFSRREPR
jgi:hypothetical protein